ncbi:MAG TPA: hypothetical protein VM733_18040 [Thermoanaerobaculia bacterium]|nr:hypothetical protein [Thermoanaerobaculia bacterium]
MAGNPREHVKDKGFWDGGAPGQSSDDQGAGRTSGVPRTRGGKRTGVRTDIEFPKEEPREK